MTLLSMCLVSPIVLHKCYLSIWCSELSPSEARARGRGQVSASHVSPVSSPVTIWLSQHSLCFETPEIMSHGPLLFQIFSLMTWPTRCSTPPSPATTWGQTTPAPGAGAGPGPDTTSTRSADTRWIIIVFSELNTIEPLIWLQAPHSPAYCPHVHPAQLAERITMLEVECEAQARDAPKSCYARYKTCCYLSLVFTLIAATIVIIIFIALGGLRGGSGEGLGAMWQISSLELQLLK